MEEIGVLTKAWRIQAPISSAEGWNNPVLSQKLGFQTLYSKQVLHRKMPKSSYPAVRFLTGKKNKYQVCLILKILYKCLHPPTAAVLHRVQILPGLASFPAPAEGYSTTQQHHRDGFQYCSSKSREITHLSPKICKPQNGNRKERFFSCSTIWSYRIIP